MIGLCAAWVRAKIARWRADHAERQLYRCWANLQGWQPNDPAARAAFPYENRAIN